MATIAPEAVVDSKASQTVGTIARELFPAGSPMAGMLIGVIAALLLVTALGIVGLASFWVQRRRRQIGIRRAMGATRPTSCTISRPRISSSSPSASCWAWCWRIALNLLLMQHYELPRLPLYLPADRRAGAVAAGPSWRCWVRRCAPRRCRPWWRRGACDEDSHGSLMRRAGTVRQRSISRHPARTAGNARPTHCRAAGGGDEVGVGAHPVRDAFLRIA